jgi:molybdate transport system regulatory protein
VPAGGREAEGKEDKLNLPEPFQFGNGEEKNLGPFGFQIKGRLWLEKNGDTFLSWGRVVLLERIQELGSIAAAARAMGMAYSHAWSLVAEMNRLAGEDLVARTFGGRHGGRAWLTPAGEEAVAQFWRLVDTFREWLQTQEI